MPVKSFRDQVIDVAISIENTLLTYYGAKGLGIATRLSTAIKPINSELKRSIKKIGGVRNKLAHVENYKFEGDQDEFLKECIWARDSLKLAGESLEPNERPISIPSPARISAGFISALNRVISLNNSILNPPKDDNVTN